jgi:hypothetical protein
MIFPSPHFSLFCVTDCQVNTMHVCSLDELNDYFSSCLLTAMHQTKYGRLRQKYEYRHCQCGCCYRVRIHYSSDGITGHLTEGTIPPGHLC